MYYVNVIKIKRIPLKKKQVCFCKHAIWVVSWEYVKWAYFFFKLGTGPDLSKCAEIKLQRDNLPKTQPNCKN